MTNSPCIPEFFSVGSIHAKVFNVLSIYADCLLYFWKIKNYGNVIFVLSFFQSSCTLNFIENKIICFAYNSILCNYDNFFYLCIAFNAKRWNRSTCFYMRRRNKLD